MTNHERLNSMTTLDLLDMISKRIPECLIYRINYCDYDAVRGRCEKYKGESCRECLSAWLKENY